jgi:hypothetical protein
MRKAPVVMLVAMLIGGSLAAGVPAAFATSEHEGPGNNAPGNPQYRPAGPVASSAVSTAASGFPAGNTASAVRGHAELK